MLYALISVSVLLALAVWVAVDMWRSTRALSQLVVLAHDALRSQNSSKRRKVAKLIKESVL